MRIGLISDTHIPVAQKELWPQVYEALRGVDLIMHGGDLMVPEVIDWLEEVAPVMAAVTRPVTPRTMALSGMNDVVADVLPAATV